MTEYREVLPDASLAESVECFWTAKFTPHADPHRVLPDGCADIIYTRSRGASQLQFVGPMTRFEDVCQTDGSQFFGVRLRPAMWTDTVRLNGPEATNQKLPLEALWGKRASRLLRALDSTSQPREWIQHFEQSLPRIVSRSPLQNAIQELEVAHGSIPLDQVAESASLSPRQFRRLCLAATGLSPKLLARILRFRHAQTKIMSHRSLAEAAASSGYTDQSHMIAEFRTFAGRTPKQLKRIENSV